MANDVLRTKRIKDWANTATLAMLIQGNFIPIDGDEGTFKFPAELFEPVGNLNLANNPEYLYAITDKEGIFLFGIKNDGSVEWAKGVPSIINNIIAKKVEKEPGKGLIDLEAASVVSSEDSEFSLAVVSSDKSILNVIKSKAPIVRKFDNVCEMLAFRSLKEGFVYTLGYNNPYDGGGSVYKLIKTLPTSIDASDVAITASNLYAVPVLDEKFTPEQFGCFGNPGENLSTAISLGFRLGGRVCRLAAKKYYTNSIIFVKNGCTLKGTAIAGEPHTTIAVNGTYQGHPYGINVNERNVTIENIAILNNTEDSTEGAGIYASGWDSGYNKYNLHINNILVYGFANGLRFSGEGKWCYDIRNVRLQSCSNGVYCNGGFCLNFENVYVDHCHVGFALYNETNAIFTNCNIGIIEKGVTLGSEGDGSTHNHSTLDFVSCNFEYDEAVSNIQGGCISIAPNAGGNIKLDCCRFFFNTNYVDASTSHILLGSKSSIVLFNNVAAGYTQGNFFDLDSQPEFRVGSIQMLGINRNILKPSLSDEYMPSVLLSDENMIPSVIDLEAFITDYAGYNGIFYHNGSYKIKNGDNINIIETR